MNIATTDARGLSAMALGFAGVVALAAWLPYAWSQTSIDRTQPMTAATRDSGDAGKVVCATCGVVEAVRVFEVRAEPPAGSEGQRPAGTRTSYRVTVKMADGSYRTLAQPTPPVVGIGDRVRIADGAVVREN